MSTAHADNYSDCLHTGLAYTTEYNAIELYLDRIYRDSYEVTIMIEPEWEYKPFEHFRQRRSRIGSCVIVCMNIDVVRMLCYVL